MTPTASACSVNARSRGDRPVRRRGEPVVRYFDESYDDVAAGRRVLEGLLPRCSPSWNRHLAQGGTSSWRRTPISNRRLRRRRWRPWLAGFAVNQPVAATSLRADLYRNTDPPTTCDMLGVVHPTSAASRSSRSPCARRRRPRRRRPAASGTLGHLRDSRRVFLWFRWGLGRLPGAGHRGQHRHRGRFADLRPSRSLTSRRRAST